MEKKVNNKSILTKILALGATSTALLGGALLTNSNTVDASSSIVLLTFKHNAYRYNRNGKRIGSGYITKGSTYYSKGVYKIHGKKYYKLDTKGNVYIKSGNLSTRRLTDQVTLKHNAYIYNIHGRRINRQKLYKGVSYFIYGSRYINGKKYYQIGVKEYIKASNASAPFSTYGQSSNNDVDNTTNNSNVSNNTATNTQTNTNTNVGSNTSSNNSSITNNQSASNNSSSSANNIQLPNNSSQGSSTGNQGSTTKPSVGNSGSQVTKPNTGSQGSTTKPSTGNSASQATKPATGNNSGQTTKPNTGNNGSQSTKPNTGNQGSTTKPSTGNNGSQVTKPNTGNQGSITKPSTGNNGSQVPTQPGTYTKSVALLDASGKQLGTATLTRVVNADGSTQSSLSKDIPAGYTLKDVNVLNHYPSAVTLTRVAGATQAGTTTKAIKLTDASGKLIATGTATRVVDEKGASTVSVKGIPQGYRVADMYSLRSFPDQLVIEKGEPINNQTAQDTSNKQPVNTLNKGEKDSSLTTGGQSQQAGNTTSGTTTDNTGNQGQETKPSQPTYSKNYVKLPVGYLEAVKNANWEKTSVPDELIRKGVEINNFHSESKADDEMKIDSDNLTPAQDFEINDFALRLINNVRAENGQQPWHYSARAQHVADRVAYLYEQDHMGLSTWHDDKALNEVDREAGIHTAELMGGDNVNYKEDYLNTMTDLKRAVYSDVVSMLFSTVELRHAQIMLTYNSIDNPTTYMGFSVSWQEHNKDGHQEHSDHFIIY